ncbi:HTH domain-containing protein [Clostridium botulinum]|uniref:helix-turn-helix domain-containing protein n=1 Tax=Clostridium botulinum TaxID=1491 RepID=UPI0007735599|nr:helix-turn-helix domain-containing protein [Clostridium botulinum]NFL87490.1 HTH domain-containing protein [Clostridium botulinum]NFO22502.1 HTH domain-containing protein [Clostridium botulinum]
MSIINIDKDRMIDMLLSGISIAEIARKLNVSRQTIYAWKKEKEVVAELESRRQQLKKTGQDKISSDICTYIDNMKEMANQKTDNRVRFQANKYLIDQCLGSPTAAKEEVKTSNGKENTDTNTLKQEIEDIKNLKVVK